LEGGGAGGGGGGTPPQNMAHEASSPSSPSAPASQQPATTPSQPSPLEGEGSTGVAPGVNYVFKLPDVGEGTAEAELVGWHVGVGDAVAEDQILAEVMTDKATVEITSPVAGKVVALHGEPGKQLAVGGPLVSFQVEGKGNVTSPLSLEGGGAGGGGGRTVVSDQAAKAPSASPASTANPPASTPTPTPPPSRGRGSETRVLSERGQRPLASPALRTRGRQLRAGPP